MSETATCICNEGFGVNLSCPVHSNPMPSGPSAADERRKAVKQLNEWPPNAWLCGPDDSLLCLVRELRLWLVAEPTKAELVALDGAIALVRDEGIRRRTADPKSAQHWFGVEIELASLGAKLAGTEVVVDASPAGEPGELLDRAHANLVNAQRIYNDLLASRPAAPAPDGRAPSEEDLVEAARIIRLYVKAGFRSEEQRVALELLAYRLAGATP